MKTLNSNLDTTDWKILEELQKDARLSFAEIGRRVGMSSPAVQERVRKLEDLGIIEGYHTKVNYAKLGLPIKAIIRLDISHGYEIIRKMAETIVATPEVMQSYQVTGQDEFILHVQVPSMEYLTELLFKFSTEARCVTSIVVYTNVSHRAISLEDFPYLAESE